MGDNEEMLTTAEFAALGALLKQTATFEQLMWRVKAVDDYAGPPRDGEQLRAARHALIGRGHDWQGVLAALLRRRYITKSGMVYSLNLDGRMVYREQSRNFKRWSFECGTRHTHKLLVDFATKRGVIIQRLPSEPGTHRFCVVATQGQAEALFAAVMQVSRETLCKKSRGETHGS